MSDDWVMVPREPTAAMIDAAYETVQTQGEMFSREAYRAMLDAAPAAPQQAEPVAKYHPDASHISPDYRDGWNAALDAVRLHQPAAEVQRLQLLVDRLDASNVRLRAAMHAAIEDHDEHRPITSAIEAMRTTLLERSDDGAVQRLRDALEKIKLETFDDSAELIARRALEAK